MPKPRVYELARELGLSSQEIIEKLKAMGIEAKAPSSSVDEDQATKFKRHVRLESQSSKKNRVYGSDEDEDGRDVSLGAEGLRRARADAEIFHAFARRGDDGRERAPERNEPSREHGAGADVADVGAPQLAGRHL